MKSRNLRIPTPYFPAPILFFLDVQQPADHHGSGSDRRVKPQIFWVNWRGRNEIDPKGSDFFSEFLGMKLPSFVGMMKLPSFVGEEDQVDLSAMSFSLLNDTGFAICHVPFCFRNCRCN